VTVNSTTITAKGRIAQETLGERDV
jgi:hypothetical protein